MDVEFTGTAEQRPARRSSGRWQRGRASPCGESRPPPRHRPGDGRRRLEEPVHDDVGCRTGPREATGRRCGSLDRDARNVEHARTRRSRMQRPPPTHLQCGVAPGCPAETPRYSSASERRPKSRNIEPGKDDRGYSRVDSLGCGGRSRCVAKFTLVSPGGTTTRSRQRSTGAVDVEYVPSRPAARSTTRNVDAVRPVP